MWSANLHPVYLGRFIFSTHRLSLFRATGIARGCRFTTPKELTARAVSSFLSLSVAGAGIMVAVDKIVDIFFHVYTSFAIHSVYEQGGKDITLKNEEQR